MSQAMIRLALLSRIPCHAIPLSSAATTRVPADGVTIHRQLAQPTDPLIATNDATIDFDAMHVATGVPTVTPPAIGASFPLKRPTRRPYRPARGRRPARAADLCTGGPGAFCSASVPPPPGGYRRRVDAPLCPPPVRRGASEPMAALVTIKRLSCVAPRLMLLWWEEGVRVRRPPRPGG